MGQIDINGAHCFDDAEGRDDVVFPGMAENGEKTSDERLKFITESPYVCASEEERNLAADLLSTRKELARLDRHYQDAVKQHNKQLDIALTNCSKTNTELLALRADAETSQNHNAAVIDPLIAQLRDAGYTGMLSEMVGQACEVQRKVKELSSIVSERHGDNDFYEAPINYDDNSADETIKMIFNILDDLPVPPEGDER